MRKAKVFNSHGCTTAIHNALIDRVMPDVSGNAWKLLCLIVRQTDGWNREEVGLSYRDLIAGMGVASRATVAAAIEELRPFDLLKIRHASRWEETRYSLDLSAVIEWNPVNFSVASVTENGTEREGRPVLKNGTGGALPPVTENGTGAPVTEIELGTENGTGAVTETGTAPVTESGTPPVTVSVPFNRKESISEFTGNKSYPNATASGSAKPGKKSHSRKQNPAKSSASEREENLEYRLFAEAFLAAYQIPYRHKQADFVQIARLRETCTANAWALTEERFRKGLANYFATEQSAHTLADLATRFSTFYRSALDRFGKPVNGLGAALGGSQAGFRPSKSDLNRLAAEEAERLIFGSANGAGSAVAPADYVEGELV